MAAERTLVMDQLAVLAEDWGPPPDADAELLVAFAHHTRDRDVWGGDRALTYWSLVPDKIRAATYAGPGLGHWWERCGRVLGSSHPTRKEERAALIAALACGRDRQVLDVIRTQTELLVMRVRAAVDLDRELHPTKEKK